MDHVIEDKDRKTDMTAEAFATMVGPDPKKGQRVKLPIHITMRSGQVFNSRVPAVLQRWEAQKGGKVRVWVRLIQEPGGSVSRTT